MILGFVQAKVGIIFGNSQEDINFGITNAQNIKHKFIVP
jgi:hypothetical protein